MGKNYRPGTVRGFAEPGLQANSARNHNAAEVARGERGLGVAKQFLDNDALKRSDCVPGLPGRHREPLVNRRPGVCAQQLPAGVDLVLHVVSLHPAQHRGLEAAEAEVERVALHLGERETHGALWIAVRREPVDDGAAGIAEAQQLGDFVVGFAGSVVAGLAEQCVLEALT